MRAYGILLISVVLLCFASSVYGQILYEVIDLGPGTAHAINNNGQIVGKSTDGAVIFDATGGGNNVTLGSKSSVALSINDNGQIVGYSYEGRAILFDSTGNGNNIILGDGKAYSINNSGQIVGNGHSPDPGTHALLFDSTGNGNNIILGDGMAYSINNSGQIVGWEYQYGGVIFASQHTIIGYPVSSNNDHGQIVGGCETLYGPYYQISLLFDSTVGGDGILLGEGLALDININGQIVGYREIDGQAVLFDPTGGGNNIALNSLTDPACGWDLHIAYAINDNGWIVGIGSHEGTYSEAFLLKPIPEPATILLFAFGAMLIKRKRN